MLPLTLLCEQKLIDLLQSANGMSLALSDLGVANSLTVPAVATANIVPTGASADTCDLNVQLSYPRICVSSGGYRNNRRDKFCSLSGNVELTAEIFSSANLVLDAERWTHYYVAALANLLDANAGDWGDGVFFPGTYEVRFDTVRAGGFGFLQTAQVHLSLTVSRA